MSQFAESASPTNRRPLPRVLFLDDDPGRAGAFLEVYPHAVWVQTVEECLAKLEERWDEVHLDHDLGGEQFVDFGREDCGMEIVRWLCLQPQPHLSATRFYVHSHNPAAADLMVMQMHVAGFQVEARPFGPRSLTPSRPYPSPQARHPSSPGMSGWLRSLRRYITGRP